jgi:hypothetical protein
MKTKRTSFLLGLTPEELSELREAAQKARLPVSRFIVTAALRDVRHSTLSSVLIGTPALLDALAGVMARPDVVQDVANSLKGLKPKRRKEFAEVIKAGMDAMGSRV